MVPTLKQIAHKAGVSTATVSKVLNDKSHDIGESTILKVKRIASELNYIPNATARAMVTKTTKTIGLLIPDIRNPFFTELARGVEDMAVVFGYSVYLCNTDDDIDKELRYLESLLERQIDGIIIAGANKRDLQKESEFITNRPLIAVDRKINYKNQIAFITTNNYSSSYKMAKSILESRPRNILYLGGPENNNISMERFKGTKDAALEFGVELQSIFGTFTYEFGYDTVIDMKIEKGTVIICGNDMIAFGVTSALNANGVSIPKDVSVIGFDNIQISQSLSPSLTTINQPTYYIGELAVELLMKYLNNKPFKDIHILEQKLIMRDSTD